MTIRGVEPAVLALRDRLSSGLATAIATINAAATDGVVVPDPAAVLDYMPAPGELVQFPTVGIEHAGGRWEDDTGWEATGVYDLVVVAFVQDADQQTLARFVRRYHLAVCRTVFTNTRNLGSGDGIPWSVQIVGFDFGPSTSTKVLSDEPPYTYWTWVAVAMRCKLTEA